jgi:DNA-binding SARP family transcriptional activator
VSVEGDWIQINLTADILLDVDEFESAYALVRGIEGRELDTVKASTLREAIQLYRGDLLENCYQDWCIFERERLQNIYLAMLDKLISYCESVQAFEDGMTYGIQVLKFDKTHERTYRHLMRLYYLAGDRTAALRQFQRCEQVLQEELGVKPSQRTEYLYRQIQTEQYLENGVSAATTDTASTPVSTILPDFLKRLTQLKHTLTQAQYQVEQEIEAVRTALMNRH